MAKLENLLVVLFTLTSPKSTHVVPMARSSAVGDHAQLYIYNTGWCPINCYHNKLPT